MPAIQQIFWTERQNFANAEETRANHCFSKTRLRDLFNLYPTLQKVHWTDAYTTDVSTDPLDPDWSAAHLFCHVARPADNRTVQPIYPVRVKAPPTAEEVALAAKEAAKVPTRKSERQRASKGGK